jgi:hypothetical protein
MYWVALGFIGLGDWISEVDRGRPFGMSIVMLESRREARLELDEECLSFDEECLDDEECLSFDDELDLWEDLWEDFSLGTSRMFKTRPVVGSTVESCAGSWETW